jgi:hypothetical protein
VQPERCERKGRIRTRLLTPQAWTSPSPDELVGFEIDGVDPGDDGGWSVFVRGRLLSVVPQERLDSRPLVADGRDAWRVIAITAITGRRVLPDPLRWAFHPAGYV